MRKAMVNLMFAAASTMTACASTPAPREKVASARQAVAAAESAGASQVPEARPYLDHAQGNLEVATRRMSKGDNRPAGDRATRSQADAELAAGIARAADATAQADAEVARARAMQAGKAPRGAVGGGPRSQPTPEQRRPRCVPMTK